VDEDFGPFFLKFCSYFPYNAKLCINVHEYLKRQLAKWGVAFEALDNGIKSCADPALLQRLADGLTAEKINRLLRKWLRRLPHPFPARNRAAAAHILLAELPSTSPERAMTEKGRRSENAAAWPVGRERFRNFSPYVIGSLSAKRATSLEARFDDCSCRAFVPATRALLDLGQIINHPLPQLGRVHFFALELHEVLRVIVVHVDHLTDRGNFLRIVASGVRILLKTTLVHPSGRFHIGQGGCRVSGSSDSQQKMQSRFGH
jgi:hypothetical protein